MPCAIVISRIAPTMFSVASVSDRLGGLLERHAERLGDARSTRRRAASASSASRPPRKYVGVEVAEHDGGVGDGRLRCRRARSRRGRGRRRRSAGRREQAARVDPGDRAAARADRSCTSTAGAR